MRVALAMLGVVAIASGCPSADPPAIESTTSSTGEVASTSSTATLLPVDTSTSSASSTTDTSGVLPTSTSVGSESSTGDTGNGLPSIGPTDAVFAFDRHVGLTGTGSLHVGEIAITDGFGTVVIDDAVLPVLAYEEQPFGEWTLYQSLAVAPDGWFVMWFYCSEGMLTDVYLESTTGLPLQYELASGVCEITPGAGEVPVQFPGTEFALVYNGEDFSITGPEIDVIGGQLGTVTIEGTDFVLAPFETVDCGDCGGAGWFEVHAMLWDPVAETACFAIFYLTPDRTDVQMTYALCLPDLVDPMGSVFLPATWKIG